MIGRRFSQIPNNTRKLGHSKLLKQNALHHFIAKSSTNKPFPVYTDDKVNNPLTPFQSFINKPFPVYSNNKVNNPLPPLDKFKAGEVTKGDEENINKELIKEEHDVEHSPSGCAPNSHEEHANKPFIEVEQ